MNKKGVTFLELILVLAIIAIGAALAIPKLRMSVENREAKAALGTLQSISQAVRLYEVTHRDAADQPKLPANLTVLETTDVATGTRYLDPCEYQENINCGHPNGWIYSITNVPPVVMTATHSNGRTITLTQCGNLNKSKDGAVTDSAGFLASSPTC